MGAFSLLRLEREGKIAFLPSYGLLRGFRGILFPTAPPLFVQRLFAVLSANTVPPAANYRWPQATGAEGA